MPAAEPSRALLLSWEYGNRGLRLPGSSFALTMAFCWASGISWPPGSTCVLIYKAPLKHLLVGLVQETPLTILWQQNPHSVSPKPQLHSSTSRQHSRATSGNSLALISFLTSESPPWDSALLTTLLGHTNLCCLPDLGCQSRSGLYSEPSADPSTPSVWKYRPHPDLVASSWFLEYHSYAWKVTSVDPLGRSYAWLNLPGTRNRKMRAT